jgi:hypothetical protein
MRVTVGGLPTFIGLNNIALGPFGDNKAYLLYSGHERSGDTIHSSGILYRNGGKVLRDLVKREKVVGKRFTLKRTLRRAALSFHGNDTLLGNRRVTSPQ